MKRKLSVLSGRYLAALGKYLKQGSRASLEPARALRHQAAAIGLQTLDMARIHERALATLKASNTRKALIEQADIFFLETISPIEKRHQAAHKTGAHLGPPNPALDQRSVDLAASNRFLKQGIAQHKTVEAALKKRVAHYKKLLEESLSLRKHYQHLTHRILSAQENNRKKISHDLQNEVAQTLLGINVRLLTVKKAAALNDKSLQKEIASTHRLVDMSVATIERLAREYGRNQET
ncbi:MAG TPA: hypothetical protein VJA21_08630 [Verrucomicrobiae bacterium]